MRHMPSGLRPSLHERPPGSKVYWGPWWKKGLCWFRSAYFRIRPWLLTHAACPLALHSASICEGHKVLHLNVCQFQLRLPRCPFSGQLQTKVVQWAMLLTPFKRRDVDLASDLWGGCWRMTRPLGNLRHRVFITARERKDKMAVAEKLEIYLTFSFK